MSCLRQSQHPRCLLAVAKLLAYAGRQQAAGTVEAGAVVQRRSTQTHRACQANLSALLGWHHHIMQQPPYSSNRGSGRCARIDAGGCSDLTPPVNRPAPVPLNDAGHCPLSPIMGNAHSAVGSCRRPDAAKELLCAAEAGDVHALNSMLQSDSRLLFHYSVFGGNSAWHKAAKGGHAAVLEALEAAVQRQYEHDNKDLAEVLKPTVLRLGTTPADVVTRLVNKSNVKGCTPLMLACSGNHTEVVSWLIKHGAQHRSLCCGLGVVYQQRAPTRHHECQLRPTAERNRAVACVGADVWKHDRVRRHTALHCAAEIGATDAIRLLLARAGQEQHPGNYRT